LSLPFLEVVMTLSKWMHIYCGTTKLSLPYDIRAVPIGTKKWFPCIAYFKEHFWMMVLFYL
jgi:hypothetical protein